MSAAGRSAIVIGSSIAGSLAAAALAEVGYRVLVLERDELPATPRARRGVPQGSQVHVVLDQGWRAMEALLPGVKRDVVAEGAACFDSGQMPWLGEDGWLPHGLPGYPMVSITRPLLELVIRRRVRSLGNVEVRSATTVRGLSRGDGGWSVHTDRGMERADLVLDASGRGSRLPHWLTELGLSSPIPDVVDARLGYATRLYSAPVPVPVRSGVVIMGTLATGTGGLAMPVERGRWLLMGGGYGDLRPPRDAAGFERFLADLRDPVLGELVERLEPQSDVVVHRQTGNRRHRYEDLADLPDGLLVVGDAGAAFNPIYGQGISVAASQAALLRRLLAGGREPDRRVQVRLSGVADLPWSIAAGADRRYAEPERPLRPLERLTDAWAQRTNRLIANGDPVAALISAQIYNLRAPLAWLLHPMLIGSALRSWNAPERKVQRPHVLSEITAMPPLRTLGDDSGRRPAASTFA